MISLANVNYSLNFIAMRLIGESLMFVGDEPSPLALPLATQPDLQLRSTYLFGPTTIEYVEGRDYQVDYAQGKLIALPGSRLPDFRSNVLYGHEDFDHGHFPGYGNIPFFAYADYTSDSVITWPTPVVGDGGLANTRAKFAGGEALTIVAYGDSITWGGETSTPDLVFWVRWTDDLREKYPTAKIAIHNGATGGDTTTQGLERLAEKALRHRPDLVLVGFGMNDHNRNCVAPEKFRTQLGFIVTQIREQTGAEIILYSTFPPNPKWCHGSHRMESYAQITGQVAAATGSAYVDVYCAWQKIAARKRPEDLLANNINHPNDFGHWIYYQALAALNL